MTLHVSRPLRVLAVGCLLAHCGGMTESPPPVLHHPALTARDPLTLGGWLQHGPRPYGRLLYVLGALCGGYVTGGAGRRVVASIPPPLTGQLLTGVTFHPSAPRMYIAARDAGTVTVIDTRSDFVLTSY